MCECRIKFYTFYGRNITTMFFSMFETTYIEQNLLNNYMVFTVFSDYHEYNNLSNQSISLFMYSIAELCLTEMKTIFEASIA